MSDLYQIAESYRAALLRRDEAAQSRLLAEYTRLYSRLLRQLAKLNQKIEGARARGEVVDFAWLLRQERYAALLNQVDDEFRKFANYTERVITQQQADAVSAAIRDSQALMSAAASEAGISATFNRLPTEAVRDLVGFLSDGSPLSALLNQFGPVARQKAEGVLIEAVALGRGPRAIQTALAEALRTTRTRALTIARTETIRAYREATHRSFQQDSDVLEGWYWLAVKGPRTCAACLALDGTFHELSERMKSHPNCRCVQLPSVKGMPSPITETGREWFAKQDLKTQADILGSKEAAEAYSAGKLRLEDFVGLQRNPIWGDSYHQIGLKRALAGEGAFPGDAGRPAVPQIIPPAPKLEPKPETFKRFNAGDVWSISEYGDRKWRQWLRELPADEKRAVQDYVGDWYDPINLYLRKGIEGVEPDEVAEVRRRLPLIDAALKKAKLRENLIMFRGVNVQGIHAAFDRGSLINAILDEPGYVSTSLDEDVGLHFAKAGMLSDFLRERAKYPTLLTIKARKGQIGAYVSHVNREFHPESPNYDNGEGEILLPRGTKFKVLSARYENLPDGRKLLHVEVEIWQPPKPTKKK